MATKIRHVFLLATTSFLALSSWSLAQEPAIKLETVVVEREVNSPDSGERIFDPKSQSATKTSTPVLETPQSVTTVTRKQMDEQNPQTVSEALRYTAGVLSDRDSIRVMTRSFCADLELLAQLPTTSTISTD